MHCQGKLSKGLNEDGVNSELAWYLQQRHVTGKLSINAKISVQQVICVSVLWVSTKGFLRKSEGFHLKRQVACISTHETMTMFL